MAIGHEPRIEPWLTLSRHSLVALANSTAPLAHRRRLLRMGTSQTSPAKPNYRGLDLEKTFRLRSRQNFFLDIPFDRTFFLTSLLIELIDRILANKRRKLVRRP